MQAYALLYLLFLYAPIILLPLFKYVSIIQWIMLRMRYFREVEVALLHLL